MMEGGETPLDVLSRAATMVQENQQVQDEAKSKQTSKWKRDRRRLPEYSRKSDPKMEVLDQHSSPEGRNRASPPDCKPGSDSPLDMSVKQRGLPPSYSQTVNHPGYRSTYKTTIVRDEIPAGISMCDPIIDEHFRRSLGNDYHTLFNNNVSKEPVRAKTPPKAVTPPNVIELMDGAGLSVDDHFAKALGDTWAKLNKKEPELKAGSNGGSSLVST